MNFSEKLIKLRKKEGLSQEELGYKLNVTRQTVSKWELGQTTPEMDKLKEMSKIFNVSVDELINESEETANQNPVIEDQPIGEKSTREKNVKMIIIGVLSVVIILIAISIFSWFSMFNKVVDTQGNILDKFFSVFDKATDTIENVNDSANQQENSFDKVTNTINSIADVMNQEKNDFTEKYSETEKQIAINKFNGAKEIHSGTQMGGGVIALLDEIITSNKTEDRKITVKYITTETQNPEEIKNIKQNIETFNNYEVTFEYDADGFIYEAIIEKL